MHINETALGTISKGETRLPFQVNVKKTQSDVFKLNRVKCAMSAKNRLKQRRKTVDSNKKERVKEAIEGFSEDMPMIISQAPIQIKKKQSGTETAIAMKKSSTTKIPSSLKHVDSN